MYFSFYCWQNDICAVHIVECSSPEPPMKAERIQKNILSKLCRWPFFFFRCTSVLMFLSFWNREYKQLWCGRRRGMFAFLGEWFYRQRGTNFIPSVCCCYSFCMLVLFSFAVQQSARAHVIPNQAATGGRFWGWDNSIFEVYSESWMEWALRTFILHI